MFEYKRSYHHNRCNGDTDGNLKKIHQKQVDYVLTLKANKGNLLEDVKLHFSDSEFLQKCSYKKTIERARGKTEKREYWQIDDISWLSQKKRKVRPKDGHSDTQYDNQIKRENVYGGQIFYKQFAIRNSKAARNHWMVDYWHLDVTF